MKKDITKMMIGAERLIAKSNNPRHIAILNNYRRHAMLEVCGRFDEIFDPVRSHPATFAEAEGAGDPDRVAAVARAIRALSSIVGETTSHELGHSLGLAHPYGPRDAYHDEGDDEGCIMEPGSSRPLGERAAEPGFAETHFCYDEPDYLATILAR